MKLRCRNLVELLEHRQLFSGGLAADQSRVIYSAISGGTPSAAQTVLLTNTSALPLTIAANGESIIGADAAEFSLLGGDSQPITIQPGQSAAVAVQFSPTRIGPAGAVLHVVDNDLSTPTTDIVLRGLGTKGLFDTLEPSLQWILDTYQIPVNVGTSNPASNVLDIVPLKPNDEVAMNLLAKAGPGSVTVDPIAVYSSAASPALALGYYTFAGGMTNLTQQYTVPATDIQTVNPHVTGSDQFDPGSSIFGLYTQWPGQKNRLVYTEDSRNTWQPDVRLKRAMRFYPLKNADGSVVPNAYVVAVEEATNHDYQDGVFIVRNVRLAAPGGSPSGVGLAPTTTGQMAIHWSDNSTNETSFAIERSVNGGPFAPLATVPANYTRYTDSKLDPGGRYQYRVRALGTDGALDYGVSIPTLIPVNYEAEAAILSGSVAQNVYTGFSGNGYVAFQNAGGTIHWKSSIEQAGVATLTFRYSNGSPLAQPLQLSVNGTIARASLSFASTGSWSVWRTVSFAVTLTAGVNDIVLTTLAGGGPVIDLMQVR